MISIKSAALAGKSTGGTGDMTVWTNTSAVNEWFLVNCTITEKFNKEHYTHR